MDAQLLSTVQSRIRCNFTARNLVYWTRNLGKGIPHKIQWIPNYWQYYSNQKIFIVDREVLKEVALLLLQLAAPGNLQFFSLAGIYWALEGLHPIEQQEVARILKDTHGLQ